MLLDKNYKSQKNKTMSKYTFPLFILSAIALVACKGETTTPETEATNYCIPAELKKGLDFQKIQKLPIERTIRLNGTIEYNHDKTVPFHSLIEGIVTSTHFSLGDYVKKGQLLAEIKSTSLNEFRDELKASQAELKVAQRELESAELMYKDGISSQKELLEAKENVAVLRSKVNSAQSNLAMFSNGGGSGVFQVLAPQSGYIVTKNITTGMTVTDSEEPLFTVADLSEVWVMANIYATSMRYVHPNLDVKVSTLAYPDDLFEGKIAKISQVFDAEERVLKARIAMANQEMKLRPGMSADIIIKTDEDLGTTLAIPNKAIVFDNNQYYVVVYKEDCKQEIRKIDVISKNDLYTYVSSGVQEGETVITTNELLVYEQLKNKL
jgi:cobalt-zinc-cadmium efflux system membrane fusion protein